MNKSRQYGLFTDVPDELWNDWHWQVANRIETLEDLKKYISLTPDCLLYTSDAADEL